VSIAILADVHANIEALTSVMADMASRGVSRIVCLGDVIGYGPNPRECLQALFVSEVAIMWNHEDAVMF
jgi:predicted phosphodiesterase